MTAKFAQGSAANAKQNFRFAGCDETIIKGMWAHGKPLETHEASANDSVRDALRI